jgi:hypothetical protein
MVAAKALLVSWTGWPGWERNTGRLPRGGHESRVRKIRWNKREGILASDLSETLDIDIENQDLGRHDQVLVLVLTGFQIQDKSWYWSHLKISVKTSLGIGLD